VQQRRRIDQVRDEEFTSELDDLSLDDLRKRRSLLDDLDTELSFYRRVLHGRMDLLSFEMRRRSGEETRSLIDALPEILAGGDITGPVREGLPRELPITAPEFVGEGKRTIDRVLGDDFLTHLPTLADHELEDIQTLLTEAEAEISEQRRDVFEAYEVVTAELTRRYREGLADASELLKSS
jgi:hypothetical protein